MLLLCHFSILVIFTNPSVSCSKRSCKLQHKYQYFFIFFFLFSGLSLRCQTCYSQGSWANCTRNSANLNCGSFFDTCMSVHRTRTLNDGKIIHEFAKSCFISTICKKTLCEKKDMKDKEVVCDLTCCGTHLCNTRLV